MDSAFTPSAAQTKYLLALEEAIEARQPVTDKALAKKLKMSRQTIYEWRLDPRFRVGLREMLERTSEDLWPLIVRRHELLALQGSVKSFDVLVRLRLTVSRLGAEDRYAPNPAMDYKIISLVPRPPELP